MAESAATEITYHVVPTTALQGEIQVPGDKSISHRALLLAAIANGRSYIHNMLMGADNLATLTVLRQLGVSIEVPPNEPISVNGSGLYGLQAASTALDLENSGTAIRLLAGILAGQVFSSTLTGDASLRQRPMARIVTPLTQMGAKIQMSPNGTPPLTISGSCKLHGITYAMPIASAQVKSCLLLAGLYAQGQTTVTEPASSRDHTERMLRQFAYPVQIAANRISVSGGHKLQATEICVPADISSAAFFIVAACITPNSELRLRCVGINPTRIGVINILQLMGADITLENEQQDLSEPTADIVVRHSRLHGITIPQQYVVSALDEFPIIFIAAACAQGQTILHGARELRVKESDRIATMAAGLEQLGINCTVFEDGIQINGGKMTAGEIDSTGDHRVAMAFAVAGNVAAGPITIRNCANVATSFPNFLALAQQIGMVLTTSSDMPREEV